MRVITGCPRSGTSFVCQVAKQLGADFGDESELIAGNRWNKNGYFENRDLNVVNHRLLFGRWSDPRCWVDTIWEDNLLSYSRKLASLCLAPIVCRKSSVRKRGSTNRHKMLSISTKLKGLTVKDPRFCYVLPPWLQLESVESVLFVLRHPWEVARSLSVQTGLPLWLTSRAWPDAVDRFLDSINGNHFYVVDFNLLQGEDWKKEAEVIARFLGKDTSIISDDLFGNAYDRNQQTFRAAQIQLPASLNDRYRKLQSERSA